MSEKCCAEATVGELIRVRNGKFSKRALVATSAQGGKVEVLYTLSGETWDAETTGRKSTCWKIALFYFLKQLEFNFLEEEGSVNVENIQRLEPFEKGKESLDDYSISELSSNRKVLSKLGDFEAAIEQVAIHLSKLVRCGVGSLACVYESQYKDNGLKPATYLGTVLNIEEKSIELLLPDDETEVTVNSSYVVYIPNTAEDSYHYARLCIIGSTYAFSNGTNQIDVAVSFSSIAIEILKALMDSEQLLEIWPKGWVEGKVNIAAIKELTFKAYMLNARAHIILNKFRAAAIAVRNAVMLKPNDKSARTMVKVIKQRQAKQQKDDKQLARNVANWVQTAMAMNEENNK